MPLRRASTRGVPVPPTEVGTQNGLAYGLFAPSGPPRGRVVVIHGADSQKENHYPFARACRAAGLVAVAPDLRGHGAREGPLRPGASHHLAAGAEGPGTSGPRV